MEAIEESQAMDRPYEVQWYRMDAVFKCCGETAVDEEMMGQAKLDSSVWKLSLPSGSPERF